MIGGIFSSFASHAIRKSMLKTPSPMRVKTAFYSRDSSNGDCDRLACVGVGYRSQALHARPARRVRFTEALRAGGRRARQARREPDPSPERRLGELQARGRRRAWNFLCRK